MRVDVSRVVDTQLAGKLLELYHAAFEPLEVASPARQSFTDEEFLAQLASENVVKVLALEGEQICGLVLIATDLHEVPWISPRFFEARFPDYYKRGLMYYVTVIFVADGYKSGATGPVLMRSLADHAEAAGAALAFDFCGANIGGGGIPRLAELIGRRRYRHMDFPELDAQHYYGLIVEGRR